MKSKTARGSQIKWERIKGRGFKYGNFSFTVAVYDEAGNSNLDKGRFPVYTHPEQMKELAEARKAANGVKSDPDRQAKIDFAKGSKEKFPEMSLRDITEAVNEKFHSKHVHTTVATWLDFDQE